jgi:hypothetical protein
MPVATKARGATLRWLRLGAYRGTDVTFSRIGIAAALTALSVAGVAQGAGRTVAKESVPNPAASKITSGSALSSDRDDATPGFGPAPSWIKPETGGSVDPKHKDDAFYFLLSDSQEYLTKSGLENFVEYVVEPLNQAGLQAVGTVAIPWNINRSDLTVNGVTIDRDGQTIDALKREDVSVIRRETKLEQSTLTGIRTVMMPVRGLQVGDRLHVAFTFKTKPRMRGRTEELQDMIVPVPFGRIIRRLLISSDLPIRWAVDPSLKEIADKNTGVAAVEHTFAIDRFEPAKERSFLPTRFKHKLIQVSTFESWDDVASFLTPLFNTARQIEPGSPVATLADKIAAEHHDPRARMLAALRLAQDNVRYVALLLGDGDYKPMTANEVWAQRYGDCKGKTVFLLALLDRLGIRAEPVLASMNYDDGFEQRIPTLAMFDHVFVRAYVGPETYYLDGTNFGQRTLDELKQSPTQHGLPLVAGSQIFTIPDIAPSMPLTETLLIWDARKDVTEKVPFEATLTLRGVAATQARQEAATSTDHDKLIETLKSKVNGVSNDLLEYVATDSDAQEGSYVVRFKGTASLDWVPVRGLKGNRFQFNQSTLTWDGKFDRDDDAGKSIPVLMAYPYWERTIEKVLLPAGGKDFTVDAPRVDQTIAATHLSRTVTLENGEATSVSDFKRLGREMDGAQASAAKAPLDQISEEFAYIVAKKKLKTSGQ